MTTIHRRKTRLEAVLWDLDGTLVDTEHHWRAVQAGLVGSFGGSWTESQAQSIIGRSQADSVRVLQRAGVRLPVEEIAQRVTAGVRDRLRGGVLWRPGAAELLADLRAHGIPSILVTMSHRHIVDDILRHFPAGSFEQTVTGDMVSNGKPHPEAYELAFALLAGTRPGLSRRNVLAIEDSLPGTTAARSAGLPTLGVPHLEPLAAADGLTIWPTLAGRSVRDLQAAAAAARTGGPDGDGGWREGTRDTAP